MSPSAQLTSILPGRRPAAVASEGGCAWQSPLPTPSYEEVEDDPTNANSETPTENRNGKQMELKFRCAQQKNTRTKWESYGIALLPFCSKSLNRSSTIIVAEANSPSVKLTKPTVSHFPLPRVLRHMGHRLQGFFAMGQDLLGTFFSPLC